MAAQDSGLLIPMLMLGFVAGTALGGAVAWFFAMQKSALRLQEAISAETLKNSQNMTELRLLQAQREELKQTIQTLQASQETLRSENVRMETLLNDVQQQENRLALMGQEILRQVRDELQDDLDQEHQERQEEAEQRIGDLLKPLTELIEAQKQKVEEVEDHLEEVEKQRIDENSQMKTLIELMGVETRRLADGGNRLADALSNSKGRGDWGEMQLARLLEASGLMEGIHYDLQDSMRDDASKLLRPDVAVKFTNNRLLYIDAKTILTNLERLEHAETEEDAQQQRKKHVAALEKEIMSLSTKAYDAKKADSIDFIVLFVPRESMLRVALEEKPDLMDQAFNRRIILASPLILMAILKTVALGWQEASLSQNAKDIHALAKELHKRAAVFADRFLKIEDRLKLTMTQFDDAKTALRGRMGLMPQMRKLEEYGCKSEKQIAPQLLVEEDDLEIELVGI